MDHGHRLRFGRLRNDEQQHGKLVCSYRTKRNRTGIPTDREPEGTTFSSRLTVALVGAA